MRRSSGVPIFERMDGKGWKPEYGISAEGVEILGYVEALPREVRRELADAVGRLCRREGYLSLHDDVRDALTSERKAPQPQPRPRLAKVIPLFRRSQRG
jgi:hypothetical protein